jgi:DNA-directed RNA polymerase subunit A'
MVSKISKLEFGMLSPELIKSMARVRIINSELYDADGYPVEGGVMDPRLGVIDPGLYCRTCNGGIGECLGHFGYLELAKPIIHVLYVKVIYELLKMTCSKCKRIMTDVKIYGATAKQPAQCPHCKTEQKKIKFVKPYTFYEDEELDALEVRDRFKEIPDADLKKIGFQGGRPEWLILTLFPIPPVTMRPSITLETGERSEDDLTHKLVDIVRINQSLKENIDIGAPEFILRDLWELLQYHVSTYFDNELTGTPLARHRSGRPLKGLIQRLKAKEGRLRGNLLGKRVNFSARTVIVPDPKISINEVGVAEKIARELTVPVFVTPMNLMHIRKMIKSGKVNYVTRPDGRKIKITDENKKEISDTITVNWSIERQLENGDTVLFNRQPSLHRISIMAHKVRIMPDQAFRINPSVCVAPDTLVTLGTGTQRPIEELRNCWKESELMTCDWSSKLQFPTELKKFWGLKPEWYGVNCYKITTKETGRHIVATADHPFYSDKGVTNTGGLKAGQKLVVRPSETPEYTEVDRVIVKKSDIMRRVPRETYIRHCLKKLDNLLPLNLKDQRTMIFARLLGHLFGDGTFILKGDVSRMIFRGDKKDLKEIKRDLLKLGFEPEDTVTRSYKGVIRKADKEYPISGTGSHFELRNKPLGILLAALGAPTGDKVTSNYSVPEWIMDAPMHIKREFLGAYFGCELTKPAVRKKTNFRSLAFKVARTDRRAGLKFIKDINVLLKQFGVRTQTYEERGNKRKDGKESVIFCVEMADTESQKNLLGRIGYIYNSKNDSLSRLVYQYLTLKLKEKKKRQRLYKEFHRLRKKGVKFKEISKRLNVSVGTLEHWAYHYKNASLPQNFPGFREWLKKHAVDISSGLVWETIEKIEEVQIPYVYDVTTIADTHNFFANGFLTKNCPPYNADFDGDEMNLHVLQNEEARAEADFLMLVENNIISPKFGGPIIGLDLDQISGMYLLTSDDVVLNKKDAAQLLADAGIDTDLPDKETFTGKEIFSQLLPKELNMEFETYFAKNLNTPEEKKQHDGIVIIENGILKSGRIDKAAVGPEHGKIISKLMRIWDRGEVRKFIDDCGRLGSAFLMRRGFTIGLSDLDLPKDAVKKIKEKLNETQKTSEILIEKYKKGEIDVLPGMTISESLETQILNVLSSGISEISQIVSASIGENDIVTMAKSGAKGSFINLTQMTAGVGQETVLGQRIHRGYRNRTLPHVKPFDLSPMSRGFVARGFKEGLTPFEIFWDIMNGREGLMDKSLRTRKSGYMQRRLVNALQDLKVDYDFTVRNSVGEIIQFVAGEDRIDVTKSDFGGLNWKSMLS